MNAILCVVGSIPFFWAAFAPGSFEFVRDSGRIIQLSIVVLLVILAWIRHRDPESTLPAFLESKHWHLLLIVASSLHLLVFTESARTSLYFQDQDITNISSAIANTATGHGLLPTAFLQTGKAGSYLGHHFAPALLFFAPIYAAFPQTDHSIYPRILWIVFTMGAWIWMKIVHKSLPENKQGIVLFLIFSAFPVQRVEQSFHNEILVILFSGIAFLGLVTNRKFWFWCGMILWMTVKEDMAVYTGLLGAITFVWPHPHLNRREGAILSVCSLVWLIGSRMAQSHFGGGEGPAWSMFFNADWPAQSLQPVTAKWKATVLVLGAFGFLAFRRIRYAALIVPIMMVHLVSQHPWHSTYYGHYAYSVLPFLMLTATEAAKETRLTWLLVLATAACYINAGDRETPSPPFKADPAYESLREKAQSLPADVCIHAEKHLSALVRVSVLVFPLEPYPGNPHRNGFGLDQECNKHILFEPNQPVDK